MTNAPWQTREEELQKETLQQIELHMSSLQQKGKWAEKIKKQTEVSQQLEEKYKNLKSLESKRLTELKKSTSREQLETE